MEPNQTPNAAAEQPDLPGLADTFKRVGLDSMPLGATSLTRKQLQWCVEYLRTGNATEAARRAGYSSPESDGAKVQKNAGVSAFLAQAMKPVAKNVDQLIVRVWERSSALHAMLKAELEKPDERRSVERIKWLTMRVDRTDMLLGSLLGKIAGVHVDMPTDTGGSSEVAFTLPPTALPVLAQIRRDVIVARTGDNARGQQAIVPSVN